MIKYDKDRKNSTDLQIKIVIVRVTIDCIIKKI